MVGDILMWVLTFLGLVPWEGWFGRKKDFQEQLQDGRRDDPLRGGQFYKDAGYTHGTPGPPEPDNEWDKHLRQMKR